MSDFQEFLSDCERYAKMTPQEQRSWDAGAEIMPAKYRHPLIIRSIDATATTPCLLIAEINGKEVGRMSISALPLVHDMEIPPSPIARRIADALFHYSSGKVKAAGFHEAVVLVENGNDRMHTYVKDRGAVEEPPSTVFMMIVQ